MKLPTYLFPFKQILWCLQPFMFPTWLAYTWTIYILQSGSNFACAFTSVHNFIILPVYSSSFCQHHFMHAPHWEVVTILLSNYCTLRIVIDCNYFSSNFETVDFRLWPKLNSSLLQGKVQNFITSYSYHNAHPNISVFSSIHLLTTISLRLP